MSKLDSRVSAFDEQNRLAETALEGKLAGDWDFVTPRAAVCGPARLSLRARPDDQAAQVTEALPGEALEVLWQEGDWARVRTTHDGYLGWARVGGWTEPQAPDLTVNLTVTALRAHAFAGPKVSQPIVAELCFGARVARGAEAGAGKAVQDETRHWQPVILPGGQAAFVQEVCFEPLAEQNLPDFALRFLETPYVWGGRSAWGLDCSGLTQVVYAAFGKALPRDADQQQQAMQAVSTPRPGDLAFFPGHVGLMLDERRMIHANATHMRVTVETLGVGEYGTRLERGCTGFGRLA